MTLYNVLSKVPGNGIVTVADYLTGEIYVDRKQAFEVIEKNDQQWHRYLGIGLKNFQVYRIEVGKAFGDLIVSVLND
jgi:hypothetical protein